MTTPDRKGKRSRRSSARKRAVRVAALKRTSGYEVKWHTKADVEREAIVDVSERVAIQNAIAKLEVDGPALRAPHQSGVKGAVGEGLRELRPRQGRSRWRPIYRRFGEFFVILAVAPEAEIDSAGYEGQVREAQKRRISLEKALAKKRK